jgi:hypothetical protein
MTESPFVPRGYTEADVAALMNVLEGADSVELKLTVPDRDHYSVTRALGIDPLDADLCQVTFFDTPDLALNRRGVVVRARRTRAGDDVVVKLRPVTPSELSAEMRELSGFGVEVDAMPGGFVCSARLKRKLRAGKVKETLNGERALRSLVNKAQRAFLEQHAPEGIGPDQLSVLGPITLLKLKFVPPGLDRRLVAELWGYPDGSRVLELSTKCAPRDAFQVAQTARTYLESRGVDLGGDQATKTNTALEFFTSGV